MIYKTLCESFDRWVAIAIGAILGGVCMIIAKDNQADMLTSLCFALIIPLVIRLGLWVIKR